MKKLFILLLLIGIVSLYALESDPSDTVGFVKYTVSQGWNALALAMDDGTLQNASDLGDYIGSCDAVSKWTGTGWQQASKMFGQWSGDFALEIGMPYMISYISSTEKDVFIKGNLPTQLQYNITGNQWNFIMLRLDKSSLTMAGDLGDEITDCTAVSKWTGTGWQQASKMFGNWAGNFAIKIGDPLMVNATSSSVWPSSVKSLKKVQKHLNLK